MGAAPRDVLIERSLLHGRVAAVLGTIRKMRSKLGFVRAVDKETAAACPGGDFGAWPDQGS